MGEMHEREIRSALVTGATGFVGEALCRRMSAAGVAVRGLARAERPGPWDGFVRCDLAREPVPAEALAGVDTVFHLAAYTHAVTATAADRARYRRLNVEGTRALVEAARIAGVRAFVFVSSVKAMGEGGGNGGRPTTDYGRSKREAEDLVHGLAASGVHAVAVRPALVYGPGVKGNLRRMLGAVLAGRFPAVPECGNRRSLVHVEDLVDAMLLAARSAAAAGRTYVVTEGRDYSTRQMVDLMRAAARLPPFRSSVPLPALKVLGIAGSAIGAVTGRRMPFDRAAMVRLIGSARYDGSAVTRELGFRARRDLASALPGMIDALRAQTVPRR